MEYRKANRNDIERFVQNRIEFATSITSLNDVSDFENSTREYLESHIDKGDLVIFLALDNANIISSCMACIYETAPLPSCLSGRTAEILNVYTQDKYRRNGHAKALLNLLIEEVKKRGVEKINLSYTQDGYSLYKQLGFVLSKHHMQIVF